MQPDAHCEVPEVGSFRKPRRLADGISPGSPGVLRTGVPSRHELESRVRSPTTLRHYCLGKAPYDDLEICHVSRISIGSIRVTKMLFAMICLSNNSISSKYAACSFLFGRNGAV